MAESRDVLMLKDENSIPIEEMCHKHQGKVLKLFCTACKRTFCSICADIEGKVNIIHDFVKLGDVQKQVKRESHKTKSESIRYEENSPMSSLHRRVKTGLSRLFSSVKSVSSRSSGVPTPAVTSSTILTPEFQLEPGQHKAGCTVLKESRKMTSCSYNWFPDFRWSFARFSDLSGMYGSVDLTQCPVYRWTVNWYMSIYGLCDSGDCGEFGLASLQTLDTCGERQRISDHNINSATLVLVRKRQLMTLEGRNWTKDVDTLEGRNRTSDVYTPLQRCDATYKCLWSDWMNLDVDFPTMKFYMSLDFEYDNRQPQSPRLLVSERGCLLGVSHLIPSPDFRPVLRVRCLCNAEDYWNISVEV